MGGLGDLGRKARKLLALASSPVFRHGLRHGVAAAVECRPLLARLPVATVVDAGAARGQFSLLARALRPEAAIIAFEPLPASAATYARLFAGDRRTRLHQLALADTDGETVLNVSGRPDCSSLLPIGPLQQRHAPGSATARREAVRRARLDAVLAADDIAPPALLKLDLQGGELAALRGCGERLARFGHVLAELSFLPLYDGQPLAGEVIAHLAGQGFAVAGVGNPWMAADGTCLQADVLFRAEG